MHEAPYRTVNEIVAAVTSRGTKAVLLYPDGRGEWLPISSDELYGRVRALAAVLQGWEIGKGDRVALISENRWEWTVADFAVMATGGVDVPMYATNTAEQNGYMLRDSGAKVAIVSSAEQRAKIMAAGELPDLQHVIVMNPGEEGTDTSFSSVMAGASALEARDEPFDTMLKQAQPEDLCTIIYTSGTTGEPKGVELTHGNLACNDVAMELLGPQEGEQCVEFLPLSHVYARNLDYMLMKRGAVIGHCARFENLAAAMKVVRPHLFFGVPRVYEKIRHGVEAKSAASPVKKRILAWAVKVGGKNRAEILAGRQPTGIAWKLADKLVYSKIREAFGGRARIFTSGSAALGMDTAGWFADVGIRIFEGYGLTETSPVVTLNYPEAHRIGTIGKAIPNVEVRVAGDGELEVRAPSVFTRYWKKPEETAEVFTEDGWFRTGDIGSIDADGYVSITDRKKEILKTSGGKMIAPQPIEGRLKSNTLVAEAAIVGDKHKFVCVLISPNFPALEGWAKTNGIIAADRRALVKEERVAAEYKRIVEQVNAGLAHFETLKRMKVVAEEWTIESGELTPSMKLKRRVVEEQYAAEIAEFYRDEATSRE